LTGIGVQGHLQRLSTLGSHEADERALKVDVLDPEQPDTAVSCGGSDQDRDDGPVAQVERSISGTASDQGIDVIARRALGRCLLGRQQGIERGPPAGATERVDREQALIDEPDGQ
jgi:hypothetical protein